MLLVNISLSDLQGNLTLLYTLLWEHIVKIK